MVQVHERCLLSGRGSGPLDIGDYVTIGAMSRIAITYGLNDPGSVSAPGTMLVLGNLPIWAQAGGLEIGDDCIIGPYFSCHPENHVIDQPGIAIRLQGTTRKGIRIGKNCWIGAKVTVLTGGHWRQLRTRSRGSHYQILSFKLHHRGPARPRVLKTLPAS
ncbi:MAG: hypothetical protein R3B47_19245 [Bacteroidia bacterium]